MKSLKVSCCGTPDPNGRSPTSSAYRWGWGDPILHYLVPKWGSPSSKYPMWYVPGVKKSEWWVIPHLFLINVNLFFGNRYTKSPIWIVMTFPDLYIMGISKGPLPNGYILGTALKMYSIKLNPPSFPISMGISKGEKICRATRQILEHRRPPIWLGGKNNKYLKPPPPRYNNLSYPFIRPLIRVIRLYCNPIFLIRVK